MTRSFARSAIGLLALTLLQGCWMMPIQWKRIARVPEARDRGPAFQVRTHLWPGTTNKRRQVAGHYHPNGEFVRHGTQVEWYRSGQKLSEKRYDLGQEEGAWTYWHENGTVQAVRTWTAGEPCDVWRSWHSNGVQASSVPMELERAESTWWHSNGVISSYGSAVRGVREGPWTELWKSGTVRAFGPYSGGERNGVWTFLHPDGSLRMRGPYRNNARFGDWVRWDPGELFEPDSGQPPG